MTGQDMCPAGGSAKPWLKATALVTVSTSGVITGVTLAPGPAAALTSPSGVPESLPAGLQAALRAAPGASLLAEHTAEGHDTPAQSARRAGPAQPVTAEPAPPAGIPGLVPPALGPGASGPVRPVGPVRAAAGASHGKPAPRAKPVTVQRETSAQQAFISEVAPGAIAAEQRYGVPASVTIAQAIDESDWGRSLLAARDNNLFGIKGTGPAGSVTYQTSEYEGGHWITVDAPFRVYHNVAESIDDHAALLATSGYYTRAMADRASPDAFAQMLTGVYATDPNYGATLISLMRAYDLYRYDTTAATAPASHAPGVKPPHVTPATPSPTAGPPQAAPIPGVVAPVTTVTAYYRPQIPEAVTTAFTTTAKTAIARLEPLYRDAAVRAGISWKLLAACDWMQCQARPRYSPVHGEKLGTVNPDGSRYTTKSQSLAQCAVDLAELASAVYGIDLTVAKPVSVRALAEVFAAYRWGGILARHGVSAMEFPYSVAGLTAAHTGMRWPAISDPDAPDKPGAKFRQPFGAVPVALRLGYPATV